MKLKLPIDILVVDDEEDFVEMLSMRLSDAGHRVRTAFDGDAALAALDEAECDVVLLDIRMPGMSGLEVCQRIRQMPRGESVPIMIVTGSDDRESIDKGFEAGATQYKTKPVNWTLLGRDVQYILRASHAFNSLKRQEDRLRYLAYYDPLTNLPNRRNFNEQLNRILNRSRRRRSNAALMFIDLDHFKRVNDAYGHSVGDRLLVGLAARLRNFVRPGDTVARLGGGAPAPARPLRFRVFNPLDVPIDTIVPLVVGHCDPDLVAAVIDTLWGGPETLIVVSSDLSHFLPYGEARDVDSDTCRRIIDKSSSLIGEQACGAYAINGLMRSRHCQELSVEAVDLRNSGDTAGDKRRVVGYGAFLLH